MGFEFEECTRFRGFSPRDALCVEGFIRGFRNQLDPGLVLRPDGLLGFAKSFCWSDMWFPNLNPKP